MRYFALIFCFCCWSIGFTNAQFPLLDIDFRVEGESLAFPLTGGFTNPQFSNCDLNRDGNNDLVVFDKDGDIVRAFIYDTDEERFQYSPEYNDIFQGLNNFLIIKDYNNDGVEDLFSHSHIPGIAGVQIQKGKLVEGALRFEQVTFPNHRDLIEYKSINGNFLSAYVSSIDLPAIADVDFDGDIDLLSFRPGGDYINYYENKAIENGYSLDSLVFDYEELCWAKVYEAENNEELHLSDDPDECASNFTGEEEATTRIHAGSTITPIDLNGDELMDLLIGDLASPNIVALFNGGTQDNAYGIHQETNYPANDVRIDFPIFISTFYVDVDNDGINELVAAPNAENASINQDFVWLYENDVIPDGGLNPRFVKSNFILDETLDLSGSSVPAIADVNQDGLLDILVGTHGYQDQTGIIEPRIFLFTNTGTANEPQFELTDDDYLKLSEYKGNQYFAFAPAFGDLDNDGDTDLIMGNFSGELFYFENTAGPNQEFQFAEEVVGYMDIDVGQFSVPQIIDVNEDGLSDLLVGERNGNSLGAGACGNINYFQNIGNIGNPDFMPDEDQSPNTPCFGEILTFDDNAVTGYSSPQLLRFEEKEWLLSGSESLQALLYEQKGNIFDPFNLIEEEWGKVVEGKRTHPRLADLNNDDKFEMVIGNSRGGLAIYGTNATVDGNLTAQKDQFISDISLHPNPGDDLVFIKSERFKEWNVRIFNTSGRLVKESIDATSINTSDLNAGLYFVHLYTDGEQTVLKWTKF